MKTKLLHFFFLVSFFLPDLSTAQYQWLQNGGGNNAISGSNYFSKEQVIDMATDSQRNIYVLSVVTMDDVNVNSGVPIAITTYEMYPYDTDFILISYTCDGSYRWHKVFGGGGSDYPSGIQIDNQDNVYISGSFNECSNPASDPYYAISQIGDNNGSIYTSTSSTNDNCQRIFLAKFDSNGVFQWLHRPHDPLTSSTALAWMHRNFYIINDVIHWIVALPSGSYENGVFSNTNSTVPFLYYVLKYDTNGTFISATPFDLQLSGYTSAELRWYRNPHNGYYYAVFLNNNSITVTAGGNSLNAVLPKIICFNDQGQYLWHSESSGYSLNFQTLDFDPQNNIYVSGSSINYTSLSNSFLGWSLPGINTGAATFIMKCNPTMTAYDWVTNHSPGSAKGENHIYYTANKVYFAGAVNQANFSWDTQTAIGPGPNNMFDPLLASFDPNTGNCTSLHRLVGNNGVDDSFTKITQDNNGDLILGGYMGYQLTDNNGTDYYSYGGNTDFFITKFASAACTPLSNESFDETEIQVYPNPANDYITVSINENINYELFSVTGQLVKKGSLTINENTINLQELSKGYYLLKLTSENNIVQTLKVLKE